MLVFAAVRRVLDSSEHSHSPECQCAVLVPGCDYVVGRKADSDILILADTKYGVSRRHGKLCYHINGEILYTDTSQFGTYIGERKVANKESVALDVGCEVRFGTYPVIWKLERMKIAVSNLGTMKSKVVSVAKKLNIPYSTTWDESCTTLIMSAISTTVKVIEAVAQCRTILTPAFISDVVLANKNKTKLASIKTYRCPINDKTLGSVTFLPDLSRKTLFEHLNFIFVTAEDMKESERLVRYLGGVPVLLDPLQHDRRDVIMSESSIVMETRDTALSTYLRGALVERGLVPTKHADLALALFYVDKARLFKRNSDTQSSQIRIQDTQCMSQMTLQETQSLDVDMSRDVSILEPSALPPPLDKTTKTPVSIRSDYLNSVANKNSSCSAATTIRPEELSELDNSKNGAISSTPNNKPNTSVFEPSAIPPKLDKTIKSPVCSDNKTADVSFVEPSAVPPRLDKTIKTPVSSPNDSKPNISCFEPSAIPPRLDKTLKTPESSIVITPTNTAVPVLDKTPARLQTPAPVDTPVTPSPMVPSRASVGSDVSLFDNSKSTPFGNQSSSTPHSVNPRTATTTHRAATTTPRVATTTPHLPKSSSRSNKRVLLSDSDGDSDDDENPFATCKSKPFVFANTHTKIREDVVQLQNTTQRTETNSFKRQKLGSSDSTNVSGTETKHSTDISDPGHSVEEVTSIPSSLEASDPGPGTGSNDPGPSQSVKRELPDKSEPINKKVKLDEPANTKTPNITLIPDITHNQSVWMVNTRAKSDVDRPFADLIITDVSVSLIEPSKQIARNSTHHDSSVVNFKRFKKTGVFVRSMDVSLMSGEFRKNATSFFDSSQPSQTQNQEDEEDEEEAPFFDRSANKKKTINFFG